MSNKIATRALNVILDQTEMIKSLQAEVTALQQNAALTSTKLRNQAESIRELHREIERARKAEQEMKDLNSLRAKLYGAGPKGLFELIKEAAIKLNNEDQYLLYLFTDQLAGPGKDSDD